MNTRNAASLGTSSAWKWVWVRVRVGRHDHQERRQLGDFLCVGMGMGEG